MAKQEERMSEDGDVRTSDREEKEEDEDRKSSGEQESDDKERGEDEDKRSSGEQESDDKNKEEYRRKTKKKEKRRRKRSRSSSRDTFDNIEFSEDAPRMDFRCGQCPKAFATVHEACVHEVRAHDTRNPCAVCEKVLRSPARLASHTLLRHGRDRVECSYCGEKFGSRAEDVSERTWDEFREHVFREILRRKVRDSKERGPDSRALRGVGRCPHGPAVRCKNFPNCPGARCIYSHGACRHMSTCVKSDCPFDHPNRPRTCMACVNEIKRIRR